MCSSGRSLKSEMTDDAVSELSSMRDREREVQRRNHELEHMLVDVEARIESMKTQTRAARDTVRCGLAFTRQFNKSNALVSFEYLDPFSNFFEKESLFT